MNGISFGNKHTYDDWDLILTKKTIGLPTPKTSSIEVQGMDGSIDSSELLTGEIKFNNRSLSFEFAMISDYEEFDELITDISNYLHGKKLKIILDEDDNYYYMGRCVIDQWGSNKRVGKIVIKCECEPYKYELRQTIITATISGLTNVKVYGKRMTVTPIIYCSTSNVSLILGKETVKLDQGENEVLDLFIKEGNNTLKFSGNGDVKITFYGGEL